MTELHNIIMQCVALPNYITDAVIKYLFVFAEKKEEFA